MEDLVKWIGVNTFVGKTVTSKCKFVSFDSHWKSFLVRLFYGKQVFMPAWGEKKQVEVGMECWSLRYFFCWNEFLKESIQSCATAPHEQDVAECCHSTAWSVQEGWAAKTPAKHIFGHLLVDTKSSLDLICNCKRELNETQVLKTIRKKNPSKYFECNRATCQQGSRNSQNESLIKMLYMYTHREIYGKNART